MAWKRSGVQFPLAPLRTLSELVFLDMARKTEMPTETGNGNSAEIHFLPTTSEFLFNSASRATGAVHGGTEQHSWGSCNAHFVRRCPARCFSYVATVPSVIRSISFVIAVSLAAASCSSSSETSTVQESLATSTTVAQATTTAPPTVTTTTLAPPTTAEATTTTTEPEAAFLSRWMGDLPDSQRLTELAIPGSHDSTATIDYKFGELVIADTAKTQNLTIDEQLRVGTRFLDIRLLQEQGILETYHGIVKQEMPFSEVLESAYGFLEEFPSEVLVMSIKEEGSAIGPIEMPFAEQVEAVIAENPERWYLANATPSLGDTRGKIVLVNRFSPSDQALGGIDASNGWSDQATFSLTAEGISLRIQDEYFVRDNEAKKSAIRALIDEAAEASGPDVLFINFISGYQEREIFGQIAPTILSVSDDVNPWMLNLLEELETALRGIFVIDYVNESINETIVATNFS